MTPADFNRDQITDRHYDKYLEQHDFILFGVGDGTFHDQVQLRVCQEPRSLAMNDFNQDGQLDLVLACSGSDQVSIMFGRTDGKFEEGPQYPVHRTPVSVASEDVNGDGHPDLAVALRNDKIKVFLGSAKGEFRPGAQYEYGGYAHFGGAQRSESRRQAGIDRDEWRADVECGVGLDRQWRWDV